MSDETKEPTTEELRLAVRKDYIDRMEFLAQKMAAETSIVKEAAAVMVIAELAAYKFKIGDQVVLNYDTMIPKRVFQVMQRAIAETASRSYRNYGIVCITGGGESLRVSAEENELAPAPEAPKPVTVAEKTDGESGS